jgi:hypothetical protein
MTNAARRANHWRSVQTSAQKYSHFTPDPNHRFNSAHLTAHEGRLAIVTDVAVGCGGRVSAQDEARRIADGEVVWSQRRRFEVPTELAASPRQELQIETRRWIF